MQQSVCVAKMWWCVKERCDSESLPHLISRHQAEVIGDTRRWSINQSWTMDRRYRLTKWTYTPLGLSSPGTRGQQFITVKESATLIDVRVQYVKDRKHPNKLMQIAGARWRWGPHSWRRPRKVSVRCYEFKMGTSYGYVATASLKAIITLKRLLKSHSACHSILLCWICTCVKYQLNCPTSRGLRQIWKCDLALAKQL